MDFLGVIEGIGTDGRVIVRAVAVPDARDPVFDRRRKRIGSVRRVFGPVDSPYVSVEPLKGEALVNALGRRVYFEGGTRYGKGKGRN
ncbi:MAG: hypothetical protein WC233_07130 [Sphaerochaeta sp.]